MNEPKVIPMLAYKDAGRAADWICRAFGFREVQRFVNGAGTVTDVRLERADGATVLVGHPNDAYEGPRAHAEHCVTAARWLDRPVIVDGLVVYVDDIEAHHAAAVVAGAHIPAAYLMFRRGDRGERDVRRERVRQTVGQDVRAVADRLRLQGLLREDAAFTGAPLPTLKRNGRITAAETRSRARTAGS